MIVIVSYLPTTMIAVMSELGGIDYNPIELPRVT